MSGSPIKVLQLVGGGDAIGGVEKMLLNYYSYMDRNKVKFDFCFFRRSTLVASHTEFAELLRDAHVYDLRLFERRGKFWGYLEAIPKVKKLIKENGYDVVHINAGRPPLLLSGLIAASLAGSKVRITHSHSTKGKSGRSKISDFAYGLGFAVARPLLRWLSTHLTACSAEAAKYMFGEHIIESPKYFPIHNAIIVEPFLYSESVRKEVRKELDCKENCQVFGHIGSFSMPKNHLFLIDVFAAIHKKNPHTILWLAGNGSLKSTVEQKVKYLHLEKSVLFLNERNDANRLYQGMDTLIFPSLWEGLSVTLVEAQAASLPIFTSSNISPEHKLSKSLEFLDLDKGADYWANHILNDLQSASPRIDMTEIITQSGYNIEREAKFLQDFYLNSVVE